LTKTCFILPGLDAGGVENYLLRFLEEYPETEWTVLARSKKQGDLYGKFLATTATILFQPIGYISILDWFKVYKYFRNEGFVTVCDFGGNFAGITMLLAYLAGVQNRISFYRRSSNAFSETPIKLMYNDWMKRLVFAYSTRILSNSKHALDYFFPCIWDHDNRFRVIHNGVNFSTYQLAISQSQVRSKLNLPINRFIIGHVGRYDRSKNHETIFKVARSLKIADQKVVFVFVGKGTDGQEFNDKLKEYDIQDICIGMGLLDNMALVYKSMDLFYFPSVTEGQPNALIEAMMSGIPFLASNIAPIQEMTPESMHGLLLDPFDSDTAANNISQCLGNVANVDIYRVETDFLEHFNQSKNFEMFKEELLGE
jgi:glycosyltransferase involved in cell wall biosynthesis